MSNLPNSVHPPWCLQGPACARPNDLHLSRLIGTAVRGDEVIQVRVGLWRMDIGPTPPSGLLLELSAGSDVERWPIDLAQSRSLAHLSQRLVRRLDPNLVRAACVLRKPQHRLQLRDIAVFGRVGYRNLA